MKTDSSEQVFDYSKHSRISLSLLEMSTSGSLFVLICHARQVWFLKWVTPSALLLFARGKFVLKGPANRPTATSSNNVQGVIVCVDSHSLIWTTVKSQKLLMCRIHRCYWMWIAISFIRNAALSESFRAFSLTAAAASNDCQKFSWIRFLDWDKLTYQADSVWGLFKGSTYRVQLLAM